MIIFYEEVIDFMDKKTNVLAIENLSFPLFGKLANHKPPQENSKEEFPTIFPQIFYSNYYFNYKSRR